jgi:hypothetical protein
MADGMVKLGDYLRSECDVEHIEALVDEYLRIINDSDAQAIAGCQVAKAIISADRKRIDDALGIVWELKKPIHSRFDAFGISESHLIERQRGRLEQVRIVAVRDWSFADPKGWETVLGWDSFFDRQQAFELCLQSAAYWEASPIDVEPIVQALSYEITSMRRSQNGDHTSGSGVLIRYQLIKATFDRDESQMFSCIDEIFTRNPYHHFGNESHDLKVGLDWKRHPDRSEPREFEPPEIDKKVGRPELWPDVPWLERYNEKNRLRQTTAQYAANKGFNVKDCELAFKAVVKRHKTRDTN